MVIEKERWLEREVVRERERWLERGRVVNLENY